MAVNCNNVYFVIYQKKENSEKKLFSANSNEVDLQKQNEETVRIPTINADEESCVDRCSSLCTLSPATEAAAVEVFAGPAKLESRHLAAAHGQLRAALQRLIVQPPAHLRPRVSSTHTNS